MPEHRLVWDGAQRGNLLHAVIILSENLGETVDIGTTVSSAKGEPSMESLLGGFAASRKELG